MGRNTAEIRCRPLRLAILVDPTDKKSLLDAVKINTSVWGGVYNPIIPYFKRIPRNWDHLKSESLTSNNIIEGYINNFDPDFIVSLGNFDLTKCNIIKRKILNPTDIFGNKEQIGNINYGIGLFELLKDFYKKKLKFQRKDQINFHLPEISGRNKVFFSFLFGTLQDDSLSNFKKNIQKDISAEFRECNFNNYINFFESSNLFFRRISSLNIEAYGRSRKKNCIFLLDASNNLDLIDYWNLRALGWNVLPIAKQSIGFKNIQEYALKFLVDFHFSKSMLIKQLKEITILKGRSLKQSEIDNFVSILLKLGSESNIKDNFVTQNWYPRIWDEFGRSSDVAEACKLQCDESEVDLSDINEYQYLKLLPPKDILKNRYYDFPKFANEIVIRNYDTNELPAEVLPEGDGEFSNSIISSFGFDDWRISKEGLIRFSNDTKGQLSFKIPSAEEVFSNWLGKKNWKTELSSSGKLVKQILNQFKNSFFINIFANEKLIKFLSSKNNFYKQTIYNEVFNVDGKNNYKSAESLFKKCIDLNIFRIGLELQCPICSKHVWFSLTDLTYELLCSECLAKFSFPSNLPKNGIAWQYRTYGPFSSVNKSDGAYSILLTSRFFSRILDGSTTTLLSSNIEFNGNKFEIDLSLFFRKKFSINNEKYETIFCECKTYKDFDSKDVKRMIFLANEFPGSILVFATLKKELSLKEKKILRTFTKRYRKHQKYDLPLNPVLILTGNELFSKFHLGETWKKAGTKYEKYSKDYLVSKDPVRLADITQQLYLDFPPWHQSWLEYFNKKRLRRQKGILQNV